MSEDLGQAAPSYRAPVPGDRVGSTGGPGRLAWVQPAGGTDVAPQLASLWFVDLDEGGQAALFAWDLWPAGAGPGRCDP